MPRRDSARILALLQQWQSDPELFGSDSRRVHSGEEKIRVLKSGPWRIFYSEDSEKILILSVVNRSSFEYEELPASRRRRFFR
ncbi:hypothetical protein [Achromobacter sp. JD417]|uniref:hypothetical protein n=1 Tax=Achromobacter sp. JD417 TaxID=2893881 RepID=UPI0035A73177